MKRRSIFLFICITLFFILPTRTGLWAGYWVANDCASDQQLILEPESGTFLAFRPEYSIFDIHGKLLKQGTFHEPDGALIELEDTVKLEDGTFFSLAFMYNENSQIADPYKIIRFTRDAEALWVKRLDLDPDRYRLSHVCVVGNVLKVVGTTHRDNQDRVVVLTFSMEGDLLRSRTLGYGDSHLEHWVGGIEVFEIDETHWGIVHSGGNQSGQNPLYGFLLLKLDVNDGLALSQMVTLRGSHNQMMDIANVDYLDEEYHILALDNSAYLFKLDASGGLLRSKHYDVGPGFVLNRDSHIRKVEDGYWLGLSTDATQEGFIGSSKPLLLKTDIYGNPLWGKQYDYAGYHGIFSFQPMPGNGLFFGTNGRTFYMLDQNGDVPGGCQVYREIPVTAIDIHPAVRGLGSDDFNWSPSPVTELETIEAEFIEDSGCSGIVGDPYCSYDTMEGTFDIVLERSLFMGFIIHVINFSIDPLIAPMVEDLRIYRFTDSGDIQFIMSAVVEAGRTNYLVEFSTDDLQDDFFKTVGYRVEALDKNNGVIDFVDLHD